MSPQIEEMLGYPVSEWLKPDFRAQVIHPEDREAVLAELQRTYEKAESFRLEYRLIAADGRTVWVLDEAVYVRNDEYQPILLQGYLVDLTHRHATAGADEPSVTLRSVG